MKNYKMFIVALCALFIIGCGGLGKTETPTETIKNLSEASKKKDVVEIKKRLSKGTMKLLENAALIDKTTPDEFLKKEGNPPFEKLPEMRGETIEGDNAYVEVKNEFTNDFEKMPLVREDGAWKVALDKYGEELKKRFDEEMNKMEQNSNVAPSSNNSESNTNEANKK